MLWVARHTYTEPLGLVSCFPTSRRPTLDSLPPLRDSGWGSVLRSGNVPESFHSSHRSSRSKQGTVEVEYSVRWRRYISVKGTGGCYVGGCFSEEHVATEGVPSYQPRLKHVTASPQLACNSFQLSRGGGIAVAPKYLLFLAEIL